MGVPTITQRVHYRLVSKDPEELTSTIVLTSKDSHFVDVRLFRDKLKEEKAAEANSEACIEWAFAGKSHTKPQVTQKDDTTKLSHTVWEHWIDSKSNEPDVDEGDMWIQEDGSVLERGKSKDPVTGEDIEYEELWRDLEIVPLGKKQNRSSLVLEVHDPEEKIRGMAIKTGGCCQAIMKVKDDLTIERWERRPAANTEGDMPVQEGQLGGRTHNDWVRTFRFGSEVLPCEYMCSNTDGKIGLNKAVSHRPKPQNTPTLTFVDNTLYHTFVSHMANDDRTTKRSWRVVEEYYW